jgi:SlyX protein
MELETRIAFQEDHIQALNRSLGLQQRRLEDLASEIGELRRQLRALAGVEATDREGEPPPPHY